MKTFGDPILFTPGPTQLPQRVLDAYSHQLVHHRAPEISDMLRLLEDNMQWLFDTQEPVLPVLTTGRGALEANIVNLFSPGDEIISVCSGRFGTMVANIAEIYGLTVHRVSEDWLKAPDLDAIREACRLYPGSLAVTLCMNESSTGVMQPLEPVAQIAHEAGMLLIADAVSIAGGIRIDYDTCGADVLTTAAQKCLMCTPGVSFTILNDKARALCAKAKLPKFFTDYLKMTRRITADVPQTPGTSPITAIFGLNEALAMIREEGKEAVFARHAELARATKAGVQALGFKLLPEGIPDANRSITLTPFGPDETKVDVTLLREMLRTEFGITVAGGQGEKFQGKMLRIGHMGYCFRRDILMLFSCLETCLDKMGVLAHPGAGIAAVMKEFELSK